MTTKPADSDPRFHGRRRGRKLRPGRELLLETVLPELSIVLPEGDGPVDPHIWFPAAPQKVWLEIGFGAGEHLAWQAAENPDVGMVGAEPYLNGVARLLSEIIERDLQNICLLADDVRPLLARLSAASLARVFVLFPDPWPKLRHHQRRIVNTPMLDALAHVMEDGAELRVATVTRAIWSGCCGILKPIRHLTGWRTGWRTGTPVPKIGPTRAMRGRIEAVAPEQPSFGIAGFPVTGVESAFAETTMACLFREIPYIPAQQRPNSLATDSKGWPG
jgi:tRNA (guanine-N7-)-methyltransferase